MDTLSEQCISKDMSSHINNIPAEPLTPPSEDKQTSDINQQIEDTVLLPEEATLPSPPQHAFETPFCKKRRVGDNTPVAGILVTCQSCNMDLSLMKMDDTLSILCIKCQRNENKQRVEDESDLCVSNESSAADYIDIRESMADINVSVVNTGAITVTNESTINTEETTVNDKTVSTKTCIHCHTSNTPLWRVGPLGPKTLCNACGLKWFKYKRLTTKKPIIKKLTVKNTGEKNTGEKNTTEKKPTDKKLTPKKPTLKMPTAKNMHLLRNKKQFLTSGLYSDEYRLQTREKKPFCFPLPLHLGEHIISNRADFTLPRDIMEEYDLDLIVKLGDKSPLFNRIRANIFVERKSKCNEVVPIVCQCISPKEEDAMGCMDDCINRMLFYECLPNYCPCGDKCSNQRFQHKQTKKLKIFQTHNRGWGLLTLENIKQGELIIEYRGEIISHALCKERMKTIYSNQKNFYFLDYCPGEVIDAGRKGSDARFINHSCSPNCHIEKWSLRNESHLGVFASQDIEANSELFYDYNFSNFGGNVESEQICHCQSEACRGTIGKKRSQKH